MINIAGYVSNHTVRGECQCKQCCDAQGDKQPDGHTADLIFFKVAAKDNPSKDEFERLSKDHMGEYGDVDPFDGQEYNYMQLGGWIGDQGLAMQYMGLGKLLGCFELVTPKILPIPDDLQMELAQAGFVSIQAVHA